MLRPPPLHRFVSLPVTGGTCAIAVAVTLTWLAGRPIDALAMSERAFWLEPWRLVTSALPHVDLIHLAFNVYWTWTMGGLLEERLGAARTGGIFVLLAAGASAAEYALFEGGVGLSGVGYGLFGLLYALEKRDPRYRDAMDARTAQLFVGWFLLCIVATAAGVWRIANVAHGAGAVLGGLLGLAMARPARASARARAGGLAGLALLLVASFAGASVLRPTINLSSDAGLESAAEGYDALVEGRHDEAIALYERAVELEPDNKSYWYNLGIAYDRHGDLEKALAAFERAAALAPEDEQVRDAVSYARARAAEVAP